MYWGTFFKYVRSGGEGGVMKMQTEAYRGGGGVGKMRTYAINDKRLLIIVIFYCLFVSL